MLGWERKPLDTRKTVMGVRVGRKPRRHTGFVGWLVRGPWWIYGVSGKVSLLVGFLVVGSLYR